MKRFIVISVLLLVLVGCGSSSKNYDNDVIEIDDLSIKIVESGIVENINTYLDYGTSFSPNDKDSNFAEVVMIVENKSSEDITLDDLNWNIDDNKIKSLPSIFVEETNMDDFKDDSVIKANETNRVHLAAYVEKEDTLDSMVVSLGGKHNYKIDNNLNNEKFEHYTLGTTLETQGFDIIISDMLVTKEVKPSNTNGQYSFFEVDDEQDNYLVFTVEVSNKTNNNLKLLDVFNLKSDTLKKYSDFSWYLETYSGNGFEEQTEIAPNLSKTYTFIGVMDETGTTNDLKGHIDYVLYEISE